MMSRPSKKDGLSPRQRLFLLHGAKLSAEEVLAMKDEEFTFDFIKSHGVKAQNLMLANIGPKRLKEMGLENVEDLRELGFDALYVTDPKFALECTSSFGGDAVVSTYLKTASDAVILAGSDAMSILGVSAMDLLNACAGAPTEAHAVLQQLPLGTSLTGVSPTVLLDTGIRKEALMELGYSLAAVVSQTSASAAQLTKLGFTFL